MTELPDIAITATAAERLLELSNASEPAAHVRLFVAGRACCTTRYGLALTKEAKHDDIVVEVRGLPIVVGSADVERCDATVIDFVDDDGHQGFLVTGPVSKGCSCGRPSTGA